MAIVFDSSSKGRIANGSTTVTFSHTCASGASLFVIVRSENRAFSGVTYAGTSMTLHTSYTSDSVDFYIYKLTSPSTGANDVVLTSTDTSESWAGILGFAVSLKGVDTSDPIDAVAYTNQSSTPVTTLSVSVTTNYDNSYLISAIGRYAWTSYTPFTVGTDQTLRQVYNGSGGNPNTALSTKQAGKAGSQSMSSTLAGDSGAYWNGVVLAIKEDKSGLYVDSTSQKTDVLTRETSFTYSHTCGGSNRVLVVNVFSSDRSPTGVTYAGVAMTKIQEQTNFGYGSIWFLLAPSTGANNIVITFGSASYCFTNAISLCGANGYGAVAKKYEQDTSANTITTSITLTGTNSMTIEQQQSRDGSGTDLVENSEQTKWGLDFRNSDGILAGAWKQQFSSGSVDLSYSLNNTGSTEMQRHLIAEITAGTQTSIKTINGLAVASVKTKNGLAIASVKTINGLA